VDCDMIWRIVVLGILKCSVYCIMEKKRK